MKQLYEEFFYIPKHGKIRDKVMLTRVATTAIFMIVCLAAMSLTAYAYFSYNVTSNSNIIKAANFEANVSISIIQNDSQTAVEVTKVDNKTHTAVLQAGEYTIELSKGESTAKTGFCTITIGENQYHTQQIGVDGDKTTTSIKLTLKVSKTTNVKILSHWGTSSYYAREDIDITPLYIKDGGVIDLTAGELNEQQTTSNVTTTTTTTTTQPTTTVTAGAEVTKITEQNNTTVATQPEQTTAAQTSTASQTTTPSAQP